MARFNLRLSDSQFFALTPRQLHLLLDRHREASDHQQYLAGIVAATVANFSMGAPRKPLRPTDFMPARAIAEKSPEQAKPVSRRLIAQNIRCFLKGRMAGA